MKRIRIIALLLALCLPAAACATVVGDIVPIGPAASTAVETTEPSATEKPAENEAGMPYVPALFEGTALELAQYEGKAVWVNFFTSWCGYCMEEMPDLKKIAAQYEDELVVVLVHVWWDEDDHATAQVVSQYGLEGFPVVEDSDEAIASIVQLSGVPLSLFIQKDGYLLGTANALSYEQMAQVMGMLGLEASK